MSSLFSKWKSTFECKVETHGEPSASQLGSFLRSLVVDVRKSLGWGPDVRVYLGSRDPNVREIERTFRSSFKWDFEANGPVRKSSAAVLSESDALSLKPTTQKIVFGLEHLRRYFANVEKEISTHPPPKPSLSEVIDRNENGSNTSSVAIKTIARRDAKAQTDRAPKYVVRGSKKGALPLVLEKRRHGKVVSVIRNVEGDAKSLLVELKHYLGTGGTVVPMRETSVKPRDHSRMLKSRSTKHRRSTEESPRYMQVEIQGNHMKRIGAYLSKKGGLSGVNRHAKAAAEALASKKKSDKAKKSDKKIIVAGRRVDASNAASKKLPDLSKPLDTKAVKKMNPTTLKLVLKARGLSTQGTKKELIKRVLEGSAGP